MRAALFIMRATSSPLVFTFSLYTSLFIHPHRQKSYLYAPNSNSCISTPIENWTRVYMNLFTRNSPYYHLLKYLLFLLKHPVYFHVFMFQKPNSKHFCGTHSRNFVTWVEWRSCWILMSKSKKNYGSKIYRGSGVDGDLCGG
jgi:hypothetical protein